MYNRDDQDTWNAVKFQPEIIPSKGIDKTPKYQFALISLRDGESVAVLESSCGDECQARRMMAVHKSLGLPDTTFYMVDWDKQAILDSFRYGAA